MAQYYKVVSKANELPPALSGPIRNWDFIVVRSLDGYPLCACESGEAAHYVEMLLNDRPLGHAKIV